MKTKRAPALDLDTIMPMLIGVWRRFHKESGPGDVLQTREFRRVVEAVQAIKTEKNPFQSRELLGAYILYYWVVHYQQALSLLGELPHTPKRVLDVCSGPAPMAFAALRHGAQEVYATDKNTTALELGAEICGRYGLPLSIRKWNCQSQPLPIEGKFDLIILGHCLKELGNPYSFIKKMLQKLTPHGFLLIVDDSFPEANKQVLELRDRFVAEGVPVQAPCVWKGECPALKLQNSPCYAQREFEKPYLIKEIQRAASINLGSLKMSYIIFRSPEASWPDLPNKPLYRVISPPVEAFHGKRFYLCGTDGKKTLGSHLQTQPPESRAFDYLKRGELISVENPLVKQNALDIIKDTKITIEAACGKPLIENSESAEY